MGLDHGDCVSHPANTGNRMLGAREHCGSLASSRIVRVHLAGNYHQNAGAGRCRAEDRAASRVAPSSTRSWPPWSTGNPAPTSIPSFHVLLGGWLRNRVYSGYLVVRNRRVQSHCDNHANEVTCRVCKRFAAKVIEWAPALSSPRAQSHNDNQSAARMLGLANPRSTEHCQHSLDHQY